MKAAIYMAQYPGEGYDEALVSARAFCAQHGLEPTRIYPIEMVQDKLQVDAFLRAVRSGAFQVVVAPYPDCFSTRILRGLVTAGVGLACYATGPRKPPTRA